MARKPAGTQSVDTGGTGDTAAVTKRGRRARRGGGRGVAAARTTPATAGITGAGVTSGHNINEGYLIGALGAAFSGVSQYMRTTRQK